MAQGYKTGGRTKGKPNAITQERREFLLSFLNEDKEQSQQDWQKLTPVERWQIRLKIEEFVSPKLQKTEVKTDLQNVPLPKIKLPDGTEIDI